MAGNMDNRIVQLQFENRQFERNIAKSKKSLDDFKKSMNFEKTSSGLEKLANVFNVLKLDTLTSNIQKLTDKFTGLGDVGEYVLSRIRAKIESAAQSMEHFIKSISTEQIDVGMDKYESLNKAVSTIVAGGKYTEDQAYSVMERAMEYTNQTSHSFQTMVGQIGALQSIGMELSEAELLLEGIGNASTKAGVGASEAASAMSLIGKVMGGSHLGLEQFNSLNQTYRVITEEWRQLAIEAGVATGNLEKKGEQIFTAKKYGKQVEVTAKTLEQTLNKKWFTSDVAKMLYGNFQFGESIEDLKHPEKVADSFGKTAYLTGQRALTLKDAINAIKESVSGGWMTSFRHIFGDASESAELFTNICNRVIESIETIGELRNNILSAFGAKGRKSFWELLFGDYANETATGAVGIMDMFDGMKSILRQGLVDFFSIFAGVTDRHMLQNDPEWLGIFIAKKLKKAVRHIQEFFQNVKTFFTEDVTIGEKTTSRLEMIQNVVSGIAGTIALAYQMSQGAMLFISEIGKQLDPSVLSILDFFQRLGTALFSTANETQQSGSILQFFHNLAEELRPITDGINKVVESLNKFFSKLLGIDQKGGNFTGFLQSVGDTLLSIGSIASKVIEPVLTFISKIIDSLSELFTSGISLDSLKQFGVNLANGFSEMLVSLADSLPPELGFLKEWINLVFGNGVDSIKEYIQGIAAEFQPLTDGLNDLFGSLSRFVGKLLNLGKDNGGEGGESGFLGFLKNIGDLLLKIGKVASKVIGPILTFFSRIIDAASGFIDNGINLDSLKQFGSDLAAGFTEMMNTFADSLPDNLGFLKDWIHGIFGGGAEDVNTESTNLFGLIKNKISELRGKSEETVKEGGSQESGGSGINFLELLFPGLGIAGIIGADLLIAKLIKTVKSLGFFFDELGDSLKKGFRVQYDNNAEYFMKICKGIALMVAAVVVLGAIPLDNLIQGGVALVAIMGIMYGFFALLKVNKGADPKTMAALAAKITAMSFSFMAIGIAVGILALALVPFAAMSWEGYARSMAGLGGVLLQMVAFMLIVKRLDVSTKNLAGFAGFAFSIGILVMAIKPFANMSWEQYGKVMAGLGGVLVEILAFMEIFKLLGLSTKALKFDGIIGFSLALAVLIFAIKPFANMSWEQYGKAMAGLGGVLLEMAAFMGILKLMKVDTGTLGGFIGFAASIAILIFSIKPFADMSWEQYAKAMAGLGGVLLEMVLVMALLSSSKLHLGTGVLGGFIGFAASVALVILAIQPFANMEWESFAKMMAGLTGVLLELVLMMVFIDKMDEGKGNLAIAGFGAFAAGLGVLVKNVVQLGSLDPGQMITALAGLFGVLLIMSLYMNLLSKQGKKMNAKSILNIALVVVEFAAIAAVFSIALKSIKDVPWEVIAAFSAGLTAMMLAMSVLGAVSSAIGLRGFAVLAAGLVLVGAALAIVIPFVGGAVADTMTDFAGHLNLMASFMEMFSSKMGNVDEGSVDKAGRMIDKLKDVLGKLNGIRKATVNTAHFTDALFELSEGLSKYYGRLKGIPDMSNSGAIKLIKDFAGCANDLQTITDMNLTRFGDNISGLGGALYLYALGAKEATGIEVGDTPDVTAAVTLLRSISEALSSEGGFTIPDNMPDVETISGFSGQLAALALAMVEFEKAGSGLGSGTAKALETLTFFQSLKDQLVKLEIEKSDAWLVVKQLGAEESEDMFSVDEMTRFGKNISALGTSLKEFNEAVTVVDEQTKEMKPVDFSNGLAALKGFQQLATDLPTVSGYISKLFDSKLTLQEFGIQIAGLGASLNDFNSQILGGESGTPFNKETADLAIAAVDDMISLMQRMNGKLPTLGGIVNIANTLWNGREMNFTDLGTQIGSLGKGLGDFATQLGTGWTQDNGAELAISALDGLLGVMLKLQSLNEMGTAMGRVAELDSFLQEITNFQTDGREGMPGPNSVIPNLVKMIEQLNTEIGKLSIDRSNIDIFEEIAYGLNCLSGVDTNMDLSGLASSIGDSLTTALTNYSETIGIGISNVLTTVAGSLATAEGGVNFEGVGSYIALGMAKGIRDNETAVTNAARAVAVAAYWAAMTALWARSPSRLFMQVGGYVSEGMAMGIDQKAGMVEDASTNMSQGAIDSAKNLVATMSRILAEDVNAQPTITPVLDLSRAQDELGAFGRNLSGRGYSLNTSVSAGFAGRAIRSAEYTDPNQNGNNYNGIYERMTALGEQILAMGESIKSMQVVLDSGVVAGGVSDGVDTNLGRKMFYAGRRN